MYNNLVLINIAAYKVFSFVWIIYAVSKKSQNYLYSTKFLPVIIKFYLSNMS